MHTVTDSFHGYWVYPSSPPCRSCPVARLQLQSTHLAGTLLPHYLTPPPRFLHGRTPRLRSVVVLHCLGGGCQGLGFSSNVRNAATVYSGPPPPLFFIYCRLLWVLLVVITIIYFVRVHGKGFPVDSSPCTYLYFSLRPPSRRGFLIFAWLVCSWSHTRETWVDGFFPGAGLEKNRGWGSFFTIASAARSLCSQ